ncbi:KEOPS complex Cgi121-like subunit [Thermoplasmatales archaeon]|nr:KEOPS complex Cgi121-like subunit [Thermoplasmatales archaeon]
MSDNFFYISILKHDCLNDLIEFSGKSRNFFLIIDLDSVVSEIQVEVSLKRARRRMENNSRVRELGPLVLMYISGQPQVGNGIKAAGISMRTSRAMIVYDERDELEKFLKEFQGMVEQILPSPLPHDNPAKDSEVFFAMSYVDFQP